MYKRRLLLWLLLFTAVPMLTACSESERPLVSPVTLEGGIFGTFYQVVIADPLTQGQARDLETGIQMELETVDAAMSIYRDDSELMAFNQAPVGTWQPISPALAEVLAISQSVAEASGGTFDVTIGGLVNLWSFGSEARPRTPGPRPCMVGMIKTIAMNWRQRSCREGPPATSRGHGG